jgi:predicted nucleotidyltransferase
MFGPLLERIATELDRGEIPYMVIGGQAVLLYGEPRFTRDIDITLGIDTDRLGDLDRAARSAGLELLVDAETFTRQTMVLPCQDPTSGIRVDFIFSFSPYEAEALGRACAVTIGHTSVRYVGVEDLVILKVAAGRPRDLEDARMVMAKNPGIDRTLVERWLGLLGDSLGTDFTGVYRGLLPRGE